MDLKILKNTIKYLSISIFIFAFSNITNACCESENYDIYRIDMFRAEVPQIFKLQEFYYTLDLYNHEFYDSNKDKVKNINEWQKEIGTDVTFNDIEFILYKTDPDLFINSFEKKSLFVDFYGNTFIKKLLLNKNKEYLEYLRFSKQLEFANYLTTTDPWADRDYYYGFDNVIACNKKLLSFCKSKIDETKNTFLKLRYTYQYIRSTTPKEAIVYYNMYFEKNKTESIIKVWAMFFKAIALDRNGDKIEANLFYSRVFELSDEKKHYCYRALYKDPQTLNKSILATNNIFEKGNILALSIINYPGRSLNKIEQIYKLCPKNEYLYLLIMREINKIEDWLYTDNLENSFTDFYSKEDMYKELYHIKINHAKDSVYLSQLNNFLITCYKSKKSINKDFLAIAIAHLSFLNNDNKQGSDYLNKISKNADPSIVQQKHVEELLCIYNKNKTELESNSVKNEIVSQFLFLEKIAETNVYYNKSLFSLTKRFSNLYANINDVVLGGLFDLKSKYYKEKYGNFKYENNYFDKELSYLYNKVSYFDNHATVDDMDKLIALSKKKNKSLFEKYICKYTTCDENMYYDIKGTIAFRSANLELAYQTFSNISAKFWKDSLNYKDYLNENPFIPKSITSKRNYTYKFNKTIFVKQLIDLIAEAKKYPDKRAANYLKIGHAFYNCSYHGNSWMMQSYYSSCMEDPHYNTYYYPISHKKSQKDYVFYYNNYYKNAIAMSYYNKVLSSNANEELKAEATYMLAECNKKYLAQYVKYKHTKFFFNTNCSVADDYIASHIRK